MLYNTEKAIVIIGDTNNGKSSTINTILSSLLYTDINFYTSNKINASKTVTIFNFTRENIYKIVENNIEHKFKDIRELETTYNRVISNLKDSYDKPVNIYLHSNNIRYDFVIIDIVGKTINNEIFYNSQIKWIDKNYPNNLKLYTTKNINIDICSNKYIIITHVDKIDYSIDETLEEIHYSLKNRFLDNTIKFISNIDDTFSKLIIKDIELDVLTKNNIRDYIFDLLSNIEEIKILEIDNFLEYMLNIKWTNLDEIIIHISKFNNKILLNIIVNELNNLESNEITENKIKLFNEAINEMKEMYECFRKNNTGVKAKQYLKNKIIELFGTTYRDLDIDNVIDIYKKNIDDKYNNIIKKSYNLYQLIINSSKKIKIN